MSSGPQALAAIRAQLEADEEQREAAAANSGGSLMPVPQAPAAIPLSAAVQAGIAAGNINMAAVRLPAARSR